MIRTYARLVAVALLAVAVTGGVVLGWPPGSIVYHAGLALLFAFAGFYPRDGQMLRTMVGGLGVLLVAVKVVEIGASWVAPTGFLHGPIEISSLIVGIASILAARYMPDGTSGRDRADEPASLAWRESVSPAEDQDHDPDDDRQQD